MPETPLTIANRALLQMGGGDIPQITPADWALGLSSPNAATIAMYTLYSPAVQAALREIRPAFAQKYAILAGSGNVPPQPWNNEYLLPSDSLSFLSVKPASTTLDPKPQRWREGTTAVSSTQTTVIWANLSAAIGVYISGLVLGVLPSDTSFQGDSLFQEAVVRFLASAAAEALAGRFDQAKQKLGQHFELSQVADLRADA